MEIANNYSGRWVAKLFSPLRSDRSEHIQRSLPHVTTLFQQHVHKCVLDYTEGLQQEEQAEWIAHCPISAISPDSFTKSCNSGSCSVRGQLKNLTLLCCSKFSIIRTFLKIQHQMQNSKLFISLYKVSVCHCIAELIKEAVKLTVNTS